MEIKRIIVGIGMWGNGKYDGRIPSGLRVQTRPTHRTILLFRYFLFEIIRYQSVHITEFYKVEHLKIGGKKSYPCNWSGCGKTLCDKPTWQGHKIKYKGTV